MTVVVDASLAGAWILQDEHSEQAEHPLTMIVEGREDLAVPHLWSYEMLNLLISACRRERLRQSQLQDALACISHTASTAATDNDADARGATDLVQVPGFRGSEVQRSGFQVSTNCFDERLRNSGQPF